MKIKIRKAKEADLPQIINLISELLTFENLPVPDKKAQKRLNKHGFSKNPKFNVKVAEVKTDERKEIAGYIFYFFTYSTSLAKPTLYLEDIYISERYRNAGIGKLFFAELIKIAEKNKCGRMEWVVLDWNLNAIKFYDKLGATELKEWKYYRINIGE